MSPVPVMDAGGLAGATAILLTVWRLSSRRRREVRFAPREFNIAVFGFVGAGKTMLLASLYNRLKVPGAANVRLATTDEDDARLVDYYRRAANANAPTDWPDSNDKGSTTRWPFTIQVRPRFGVIIDAIRLNYLDYSGDSLKDAVEGNLDPGAVEVLSAIMKADVLMGVLDGGAVKRYLEGDPQLKFQEQMGVMLTRLSGHGKPVHLILTKWDIIEPYYKFPIVVERLMQLDHFADFAASQTALKSPCRLIPVSAVGVGFVRYEEGKMVRQPEQQINPFHVQMPLACALTPPDHILLRADGMIATPWRRALRFVAGLPLRITLRVPGVAVEIEGLNPAPRPGQPTSRSPTQAELADAMNAVSDFFANLNRELDDNPDYAACRLDKYRPLRAQA